MAEKVNETILNPLHKKIRVNFKIWYEYEHNGTWLPLLGEQKIALLKALRDHGSINMASRKLHLDYKKAWDMLHQLNSCEFCKNNKFSFITKNQGKGRRSGTHISPFGMLLLNVYDEVYHVLSEHVTRINQEYFQS